MTLPRGGAKRSQPDARPTLVGRSDLLPGIRQFLEFRDNLKQFISPIASYPVVVDANVFIGELLFLSKQGTTAHEMPELLECLVAQTLVAYVTSDIVAEVERNMERLALKRGFTADVWTTHWAAYKPLLRVEDPDPPAVARHANGRDPSDAPTVALAEILAVCGILSKDKDIKAMGGKVIPIRFKIELRDYSRQAAVFVSLQIGGYYVALGTVDAIAFAASALGRVLERFRTLPDAVKILAVVAVAVALLHPTSRKAILDALKKIAAAASDAFPAVMAFLLQAAQVVEENRAIPPVVTHL
ncbi:MAG TPA: PIN domain-containing protein [Alphaproteobacteria bacterium]